MTVMCNRYDVITLISKTGKQAACNKLLHINLCDLMMVVLGVAKTNSLRSVLFVSITWH